MHFRIAGLLPVFFCLSYTGFLLLSMAEANLRGMEDYSSETSSQTGDKRQGPVDNSESPR